MPPLFGKDTHIHPTDFSLTASRGTTTVYAGAGLNLHASADSAFQLPCYSGCDIAFEMYAKMKTRVRGRLTVLRGAAEGTPFTRRFLTIVWPAKVKKDE